MPSPQRHQGGSTVARRKPAAKASIETAEATPEIAPRAEPTGESATGTAAQESRPPVGEAATEPPSESEPHALITASLGDVRGGPEMHLPRSHRCRQMQIRFDGGQPDEQHLAMLQQAGWRDRTEEEGVWTKQIDPNARWQSVQQME